MFCYATFVFFPLGIKLFVECTSYFRVLFPDCFFFDLYISFSGAFRIATLITWFRLRKNYKNIFTQIFCYKSAVYIFSFVKFVLDQHS